MSMGRTWQNVSGMLEPFSLPLPPVTNSIPNRVQSLLGCLYDIVDPKEAPYCASMWSSFAAPPQCATLEWPHLTRIGLVNVLRHFDAELGPAHGAVD